MECHGTGENCSLPTGKRVVKVRVGMMTQTTKRTRSSLASWQSFSKIGKYIFFTCGKCSIIILGLALQKLNNNVSATNGLSRVLSVVVCLAANKNDNVGD